MAFFVNKLKRAIIYHTLFESFTYFFRSFYTKLNDENKILEFENKFAKYNNQSHSVVFPFARTAIYYILKHLNLPKGTEVLMSPIGVKGILDVILELGLIPKFVELDLDTLSFELKDLNTEIGNQTKVVIITYLFGLVPNMNEITNILKKNNIFIIEDFSQCINGKFNEDRVGSCGDVGVYSSSSIKTIDTLGGGLVVTNSKQLFLDLKTFQNSLGELNRFILIKKGFINLIRNLALNNLIYNLFTFHFLQGLRKLNPELALKQTGSRKKSRIIKLPNEWFFKFSSMQAEIGLKQIIKCNNRDKKRIINVNILKENIGKQRFPLTTSNSYNVYWQLIIYVSDSISAQKFFASKGIDVATSSLELLSSLESYPNSKSLKNAEKIYLKGLLIPCYPSLNKKALSHISNSVKEYFNFHQ